MTIEQVKQTIKQVEEIRDKAYKLGRIDGYQQKEKELIQKEHEAIEQMYQESKNTCLKCDNEILSDEQGYCSSCI